MSPVVAVGAVGVPVNAGDTNGAFVSIFAAFAVILAVLAAILLVSSSSATLAVAASTMIAFVFVDQASQIAMIIAIANLHVQGFAAGVACNLMKPPNGRL